MTLRTRTLLTTGTILITLVIAQYLVLRTILLNSLSAQEDQQIIKEIQDISRNLSVEASNFGSYLEDWSYWDDTYEFVQDHNEEYVESNLTRTALNALHVNVMLFIDTAGDLVHAIGFDSEGDALPTSLLAEFYNQALAAPDAYRFSGYVNFMDGVILLAGRPILPSSGAGSPQGTLVWGRILPDHDEIGSETIPSPDFALTAVNQPYSAIDQQRFLSDFASGSEYYFNKTSARIAYGYAMFFDLHQQPSIVIRVAVARTIYLEGQRSLSLFLLTTLLCGLILCLGVVFVVDRYVLRPLLRLSHEVRVIASSDNFNQRVTVRGKDELAHLQRGINYLLGAVETSSGALKQLNSELEDRVFERTAELEEKNIQLARMQQQKDEFFARASHELRTPLTNIITRLYLLERQPEQMAVHMRVLKSVSTHMRDLLNELLDLSRIQRDALVLNRSTVQLQEVVRGVIDTQYPEAENKNVLLCAEMHQTPLFVYGDAKRLTQIATNLINNAILYTADGGKITVQVYRLSETEGVFSVRDSGIGIAEEHLSRLFEPFFRAREEVSTGTGLGLSIVSELVRLHNGSISVESKVGSGSQFMVKLPLIAVTAAELLPPMDRVLGDQAK